GVCVLCGYADIRALHVDHIIPLCNATHRQNETSLFLAIIRGEAGNVQLLCANCHAIKTYNETFIE
ncbi:MAG TPA: hypothetical protein VED37_16590, partial [Ktedonobacteraceae bacterium]|nr:hypothetical protein [Ktedonobacteraceae bacterium]